MCSENSAGPSSSESKAGASDGKSLATLVAAIIAAIAALLSAGMAATVTATATADREFAAFRRSQVEQLTNRAFESSVMLAAEFASSSHVPWIAQSDEAKLVERSSQHIETIRHAYVFLSASKAVPESIARDLESVLSGLLIDWQGFSSARAGYRDGIAKGSIEMSGQAHGQGKRAEDLYLEKRKVVGDRLVKLRELVAQVRAATVLPAK